MAPRFAGCTNAASTLWPRIPLGGYLLPMYILPKLCSFTFPGPLICESVCFCGRLSAVWTQILPPSPQNNPLPARSRGPLRPLARFLSPRLFFPSSKSSWDTRRGKKNIAAKEGGKTSSLSLVLRDGLNLRDIGFLNGMFYVLFLQGKKPAPLNPSLYSAAIYFSAC